MQTVPVTIGYAYVVVASAVGNDRHPAWYLNLVDHPRVEVAVAGKPPGLMVARVATSDECDWLWPRAEGYNLRFARAFKAALSIPVICVGGLHSRARMEAALADGDCDAISCGRAFIADPFLYRHLRESRPGPACVYCNACVGVIGSQALDCFHPEVRRQKDAMLAGEVRAA